MFPLSATATVLAFPSVPVDWLAYESSSNTLLSDDATFVATLNLTTNSGFALPTTPGTLNNNFWLTAPSLTDSQTGNASLSTFEIRHLPTSGSPSYQVDILLPKNSPLILAVGQLFADSSGASDQISINTFNSNTPQQTNLLGFFSSDNGLIAFDQELTWNPTTNQLNPLTGNDGESQIAFFGVSNADKVSFIIPSAYGLGTGDTITFAIGTFIPEPSTTLLLLTPSLFLIRRKR
ncbi:MAG: hypothetical protein AAGC74_02800 [Verrucomicrobiota bacterium]